MKERTKLKFGFKHDEAFGWHVGIHFCIGPKDVNGEREIYLFICLGKHDFSIGRIYDWANDDLPFE